MATDSESPETSRVSTAIVAAGRAITRLPILVIGLGLLAIGLGYNGASSYDQVAAQFPYLISGGVLGLGLIVIGVGMMITQSHREDSARLEALLTQLVETTSEVIEHAPDDLSELLESHQTGPIAQVKTGKTGYAPKPR